MLSDTVIAQRLLLVTLIAGLIGFERERHGRAAGFRTHILVGVGSCLIMLTGIYLAETFSSGASDVDPTRMAAQVISGIGFLGAGTILRFRASVRGLTTAASLWAISGVGLAVGAGFLSGALIGSGIIIVSVLGFTRLERSMRRDWYQTLVIETAAEYDLAAIRALLAEYDVEIRDLDVKKGRQPDQVRLEFEVKLVSGEPREGIVEGLRRLRQVVAAYWV